MINLNCGVKIKLLYKQNTPLKIEHVEENYTLGSLHGSQGWK